MKYQSIKDFMPLGTDEPNYHYRPWLEENIGEQNIDWGWEIYSVVRDKLIVYFEREEDAILFELRWP